uniref:Ig-like domain-containing protein n=1 Tax=Cyprinus carpio TaxID=7962 RepID=A0A8C1GYA9_CYPCA
GSCHASGLWRRFGPAHFECRLTPIGDPTMIVEWLHDSKPLEAANRLRMINEFGYCSLDYEAAYSRDSGVITCRATNKFGVDQTSSTLIVKDEKSLVEETQFIEVQQVTSVEEYSTSPTLTLKMNDVIVSLGDVAQFNCSFSGQPFTEIIWDHNGRTITNTERVQYVHQDGSGYLKILGIQQSDSGLYSCRASNPLGETSCNAELIVFLETSSEATESRFLQQGQQMVYTTSTEDRQAVTSEQIDTLHALDISGRFTT